MEKIDAIRKSYPLYLGTLAGKKFFVTALLVLTLSWIGLLPDSFVAAKDQRPPGKIGGIRVENAWIRFVPYSSKHTVAYMILRNHGNAEDRLLSVQSDVAQVVEMHQVLKDGDLVSMQPVEYILVPAHESTALEPGGYHLMLINLQRVLKEREHVSLTLQFEHAGDLTLIVEVRSEKTDDDHSEKIHDSSQKEH